MPCFAKVADVSYSKLQFDSSFGWACYRNILRMIILNIITMFPRGVRECRKDLELVWHVFGVCL